MLGPALSQLLSDLAEIPPHQRTEYEEQIHQELKSLSGIRGRWATNFDLRERSRQGERLGLNFSLDLYGQSDPGHIVSSSGQFDFSLPTESVTERNGTLSLGIFAFERGAVEPSRTGAFTSDDNMRYGVSSFEGAGAIATPGSLVNRVRRLRCDKADCPNKKL